ncbi:MAG TPA: TonB-dependent receptor [Sphingomicrobium sp.]|nr:TonB-dependent receptor [Sphingomicrobium sp.]
MTRLALLLLCGTAFAAPAQAQPDPVAAPDQEEAEQARQEPPPAPETHHDQSAVIVVTGVRELNILAGTSVLAGNELQREVKPQLGESLTSLPGVSATSFSPGASRPVLRGLQGERIRVLTDGIGSIDVSNTSADHAVTIDPLTADRIEVLRGPAVLLYGSQAIGGAVNVIDKRIPRHVPEEGFHADVLALYGTAADERSIGGAVEFALGGGLVAHLDGSFRKTDDLRTGGHVLSPQLRAEQFEIAEEELDEGHVEEAQEALELANLRGEIPNSALEQKTAAAGLALVRDRFSLGASVSVFDTEYGVPMRPGAEHHHDEGLAEAEEEEAHHDAPVRIALNQIRLDIRGEYAFDRGFLDRIKLRIGAADYEHTEFEGDEVGTVFNSNGVEGRLEFVQRDTGGWRGASGLQYFTRDFEAIGAEAFVPPNQTDQAGLFTLQEFDLGRVELEAAARYEHSNVRTDLLGLKRRFDSFSGALGASYELAPRVTAGVNLSRTERSPAAEELFANGPHIASQSFELGNPDLKKEKSLGLEAYARMHKAGVEFSATMFANWFDDFIYQQATGEEEDELPVFAYRQRDARFYGIELEASARLFEAGRFRFVADGVADYVRATIKGGGPIPRIPPLRLLGGIEAQSDRLDGRLEVEWFDEQDRIAEFENPTEGFTLVNASLAWRPWGRSRETTLMLSANNIFDVEARRHASFTKDFVPMAGRDIRLSARFAF